jgi:hypothetical protein
VGPTVDDRRPGEHRTSIRAALTPIAPSWWDDRAGGTTELVGRRDRERFGSRRMFIADSGCASNDQCRIGTRRYDRRSAYRAVGAQNIVPNRPDITGGLALRGARLGPSPSFPPGRLVAVVG